MSDDFRRALEVAITEKVDGSMVEAKKAVTRSIFEHIYSTWPVDTAYSLANHRISITGQAINRVEPYTRPTEKWELLDKAIQVHESELAKLDRLHEKDAARIIVIGNAVEYAEDVGFEVGAGRYLYDQAAAFGEAALRNFIQSLGGNN